MSAANANAIPLTPQFLFEALQAASSQVQDLVKNASAQLKDWERQPGYWSLLQVSNKLSVPFLVCEHMAGANFWGLAGRFPRPLTPDRDPLARHYHIETRRGQILAKNSQKV